MSVLLGMWLNVAGRSENLHDRIPGQSSMLVANSGLTFAEDLRSAKSTATLNAPLGYINMLKEGNKKSNWYIQRCKANLQIVEKIMEKFSLKFSKEFSLKTWGRSC